MNRSIFKWFKVIYALAFIVAFYFVTPINIKNVAIIKENPYISVTPITYNSIPNDVIADKVITTITGQLTGYGPDCDKCSGITASGMDVRNGNIYYNDQLYGKIRIVAASKNYKLGTVIRINAPRVSAQPFIAIILDRGVSGNTFDLLFDSQSNAISTGRQRNIEVEILRDGY